MATINASDTWVEDEVTPTLGQITFILSQAPADPASFTLRVNGVAYDNPTDYTISGVTVTWLNTEFSLDATDLVQLRYQ